MHYTHEALYAKGVMAYYTPICLGGIPQKLENSTIQHGSSPTCITVYNS